jgi:hypothetical protein
MTVMVPPGMIVIVTRTVVVIGMAVVVTRIIVGIVISRSEGKAEVATCLRRLWSDSRQTESGEPDRKGFFHTLYLFVMNSVCRTIDVRDRRYIQSRAWCEWADRLFWNESFGVF